MNLWTSTARTAALIAALTAASAHAATLSINAQPLIDLPGFTAYTFNLDGDGFRLNGFEMEFLASELNQYNPLGIETVFSDNNVFLENLSLNPAHDTQLLFNRNLEPVNIVTASESDRHLYGTFATRDGSPALDVTRIVLPDGAAAEYSIGTYGQGMDEIDWFSGRIGDPNAVIQPLDWQPPEPEPTITNVTGELSLSLKNVQRTAGMPGYSTYTLEMTSTGEVFALEVDLAGEAIHQAPLPGLQSVFNNLDIPMVAAGIDPASDTHLLFSQDNYPLMNIFEAHEDDQHLFAEMLFDRDQRYLGGDFIQVVLKDGDLAYLDLKVYDNVQDTQKFKKVIGQIGDRDLVLVQVPEPASLITLAALALIQRRRSA
ncbi:hypothetical protein [Mucisphaera calidilacus]|uniref:PEP-CTERM protein-sorting domain-containing protein n=1 Tax=Mucisphaera calidilacus TaxID=2527982 RepID=A0A518BX97_9BACT|nr:hypothetical protein [Mucisphaera calidilacus]QDU71601.1 hypothetical protein Pan265_14530 [Mucisphaera calidilacus]